MGQVKPTKRQIAAAIGVSPPMVSKYLRQGMPAYSIDAAIRWREQHIDPMRRKEWLSALRAEPAEPTAPPVDLARIDLLFDAAAKDFARWEQPLRAALRAVPREQRSQVRLDVAVTTKLIAPALAAVADVLQPELGAPMTDADAEGGGAFLYAIAAGEIFPVGNKLHISPAAHHLVADD